MFSYCENRHEDILTRQGKISRLYSLIMNIINNRLLNINLPPNRSAFFWGPRKTGKTHWIGENFKDPFILEIQDDSPFIYGDKGIRSGGCHDFRSSAAALFSPDPVQDLRAYIADYLKEEIASEAAIQNIPAFAEFLRIASLTSGELLPELRIISIETGPDA